MDEGIRKILECGALAPSGGNSQPWYFRAMGNVVEVVATPEKDHRILNFRNRGTWIAHGALLENMLIAASEIGYRSVFQIFPDKSQPNMTIRIAFEKFTSHSEPLYRSIRTRSSNRKPYHIVPLTPEQKSNLLAAAHVINGGDVSFIEGENIKNIAEALSATEVIMLENKLLHKLFIDEIVWTEKEEQEKKHGLYLKTMELQQAQQFMLRQFLRYWPIMNFLNRVGFAKMIAKGNAEGYAATAAMGAIMVEDNDEAFLTAGRMMERIWLEATRGGLSMHILTGVPFLFQRAKEGKFSELSSSHIEYIEKSYHTLAQLFHAGGLIALCFRIGKGDAPSARSSKMPPMIRESK